MNIVAVIVMLGWIPAVLWMFSRWPAPKAMITSFIVAWLFLPQVAFVFRGIPDYTKMTATCYGILLATLIFDVKRFRSFRPSWVDIPILLFCSSPLWASLTNGLGVYDGLSSTLDQLVTWGFPYFLGRLYLNNLESLRNLAIAIIYGGLAYIPLCLLEARLSPQLHRWVYGFHAHQFIQSLRVGGYRPTVFMQHGLMVGVWMMTATLLLVWLWQTRALAKTMPLPILGHAYPVNTVLLVIILVGTFVFLRATGALVLFALALAILFMVRHLRTWLPLLLVVAVISGYLYLGVSGQITQSQRLQVTQTVAQVVGKDRAQSLSFRLENEEALSQKARKAMVFGWGGWGRSRIIDDDGVDRTVTDSLWIIIFGQSGLWGLTSWMAMLLLPVAGFCARFRPTTWALPQVAPAAGLTVILLMYTLDCILNSMINPIFILLGGGLSGLILTPQPLLYAKGKRWQVQLPSPQNQLSPEPSPIQPPDPTKPRRSSPRNFT
jgi:hypothetical protein